ncbi:MAG: hypothetical protein Q7T04_04450 [Dehalococcoidia bacterium]|nr:hypothetical protein [Dehalococcoidia bacterium]
MFAVRCAKCHGEKGEGFTGPAIIGPNANLGKYANAQGLINFMGLSMPLDAPGSLSSDQYQQLLCFVLVKNNLVAPASAFNASQLDSVNLK